MKRGKDNMSIVTIKQLLETGVHFGHQTSDWNPRMDKYIFTSRNKIHIIDLEKTIDKVREAYNFVRDRVAEGEDVLFVCTKRQGSDIVAEEASRCGMYYVSYRWWGGMLTNFKTIRNSIDHLLELEEMEQSGVLDRLSKKEKSRLMKEKMRLDRGLCGIKDMQRHPGVMFVVDLDLEDIAVAEARKLKIPIVALVDTNCDPEVVDYVIPGNDDAIRSIKLITSVIADAVEEGMNLRGQNIETDAETEKISGSVEGSENIEQSDETETTAQEEKKEIKKIKIEQLDIDQEEKKEIKKIKIEQLDIDQEEKKEIKKIKIEQLDTDEDLKEIKDESAGTDTETAGDDTSRNDGLQEGSPGE
jgi:small subunit ribosomal protein S2